MTPEQFEAAVAALERDVARVERNLIDERARADRADSEARRLLLRVAFLREALQNVRAEVEFNLGPGRRTGLALYIDRAIAKDSASE